MPAQATVFFDGYCPLCRREVAAYRRLAPQAALAWHDIALDPPDPQRDGFDLGAALASLHLRDADGRLHTGLDAHLRLWQELPGWRHLAGFLQRRPRLRSRLDVLYRLFTRYRPGLRRRRRERGHD